ncbi:MAG TPA: hypothetical protein VIM71_16260 [Lacunisphaera sp.]
MRKTFLCLLFSVLGSLAQAAEPTDLSQGLGYLRVHSLDEAPKALAGAGDLVLDLRRTIATPEAVAQFSSALAGRAAESRLFVLVGPDTPVPLADALKGSLLTIGIKGSHPAPEVVVRQSDDDDRKAYDALEAGAALTDLISGKVEKDRYDEATLVQEFKGGNHDAHPPESAQAKNDKSPARLTDRVLQRAVNIHRALTALKR